MGAVGTLCHPCCDFRLLSCDTSLSSWWVKLQEQTDDDRALWGSEFRQARGLQRKVPRLLLCLRRPGLTLINIPKWCIVGWQTLNRSPEWKVDCYSLRKGSSREGSVTTHIFRGS